MVRKTEDPDRGTVLPPARNMRPNLAVPLLPIRRRMIVYGIGGGVWLTGALWVVFHYFLMRPGQFGPAPHPLEWWWLASHGGFAFASLWLFGLLWGVHIPIGWRASRRRWSGGAMFALALFFIVSGYALYYVAGSDESMSIIAVLHWSIGLISPALFFLHHFARENRGLRAVGVPTSDSKPERESMSAAHCRASN